MGDLLARIQTTKPDDGLFPVRPDYGDQRPNNVSLWANYFEMILHNPNLVLYVYEMSFEAFPPKEAPEKDMTVPEGKKLMQVIRCALSTSTFYTVKYDIAPDFGRTLISCKKLENKQMQTGQFKFLAENATEDGEPKPRKNAIRFRMTLQDKGQLHLPDLVNYLASSTNRQGAYESIFPIVQALDIILSHYAKLSLKIATPKQGKCFPLEPTGAEKFRIEGPKNTQGYLQGVRGFFASVRATTARTLVNCNACCGAFYKPGPLEDLFAMFVVPNQNTNVDNVRRLENAIQGLRVELTHLKNAENNPVRSLRTILGLARPYGGPKKHAFYHKEDEQTYTVAEHWAKKGYEPIRNFAYPVIIVGDRKNPTLLPPHVCRIVPGQTAKRKLDPVQTTDMIECARRGPEKTRNSINADAFGVLGLANNPTLNSFGISLKSDMVTVQGRVLGKPTIMYNTGSTARIIDDKARWNLRGRAQVYKAGHLEKWAILRITRGAEDPNMDRSTFQGTLHGFVSTLRQIFGDYKVDEPAESWPKAIDIRDEAALEQEVIHRKEQGIRFLILILPDKDASTYKLFKRIGDVDRGINTVCVLGDTRRFYKAPASAGQYFANVGLKINLKLGGINHVLENQRALYKNTMVIGIDVTHPSPGPTKKTAPSVAAMVASVDDQLAQWPADLRINTAGKEMVDLLGPMLTTRLELWKEKHGKSLPDNLLIYRDGVSEGQYKAVLEEELGRLKNTCEFMYRGANLPKITLIIVGKRHHTRFFKRTRAGDCTNPEFGTVVDTGVTEARNWDFFLQSHHALLGTARPAHYFVLRNEIFTQAFVGANVRISEYLHKLTYEMCYLFGRSTGPVSIPPPVYYADLACERSRCYGDFDDDVSDASSMAGDDRGKPQGGLGEAQSAHTGHGSGSPVPYRPLPSKQGPSNQNSGVQGTPGSSKFNPNKQGSGSTAPGKKEGASKKPLRPTEGKMPDLTAGLTKKEKARLFEERAVAAQRAAQKGSSKAEGKKLEAKAITKAEGNAGEEILEGNSKGKVEEGEVAQSKAQGKKPEAKTEIKKPKEKAKVEVHPRLKDTMFYI